MTEDNDNIPSPDESTVDPPEISPAPSPGSMSDPLLGTKIGSCTLKRLIGSGGMGTVYEAIQEQPRRRVALKMMKRGITSRSATRRFEFESQTLARLKHQGVAQVYEAGTHDDGSGGVPYFVMEYIANAKSITQYADEKKLGTRERLAIFSKVCDAVQHGHLKGIVHRDLKPGNILIDSTGQPKVIDFGVARSTDSDMAVTTLQTDVGQLIGTLQYMSPEQCEADPSDIDARSDVYALGVVLYELLTGRPPYDLKQKAIHEAVRIVREEEPTKLSTFDRHLRGDIETIALKALEKERERRYQSATALEQDINSYLNDEPISARPPGAIDYLRRFARKHTAAATAIAVVSAILVVAVVGISIFAIAAVQAEDKAREEAANAKSQELKAVEAKDEAVAAKNEALKQSYFGNFYAAKAAFGRGDRFETQNRLKAAKDALSERHRRDALALVDDGSRGGGGSGLEWVPFGSSSSGGADDSMPRSYGTQWLPFELRLLNAQMDDSLFAYKGNANDITSVAFNSDGSRIASVSYDDTLRIWEEAILEKQAKRENGNFVSAFGATFDVFAPVDSRIASRAFQTSASGKIKNLGYDTVDILDAESGDTIHLLWHQEEVEAIAVSRDGSRIASGGYDYLRIWDVATGKELATFGGEEFWEAGEEFYGVLEFVFTPDGTQIAIASMDGILRILDVVSGEIIAAWKGAEYWDVAQGGEVFAPWSQSRVSLESIDISPDGSQIAVARNEQRFTESIGLIQILDIESGKEMARLKGHIDQVNCVAFSPDGSRIVSGGNYRDQTVRVWDVETGEELATLRGNVGGIDFVYFSPDGSLISSCGANQPLGGGRSPMNEFSEKTVRIYDSETGVKVLAYVFAKQSDRLDRMVNANSLVGHTKEINTAVFSPDGSRIASAGVDGTVRIWDVVTSEELAILAGHEGSVDSVDFSPDGLRLASAGYDSTVRVWDTTSGEELARLGPPTEHGYGNSVAFSPNGSWLASAGVLANSIHIWDTENWNKLETLVGPGKPTHDFDFIAFSPDSSKLVTTETIGPIRIWDTASWKEILTMFPPQEKDWFSNVALSPDGLRIAATTKKAITIWDVASGELLANLDNEIAFEKHIDFSPDGLRLALSDISEIQLMDVEMVPTSGVETRVETFSLKGQWSNFSIFSPDGSKLAVGGVDGMIHFFDTRPRGQIAYERRLARDREKLLSPEVASWFVLAGGNSRLVLTKLEREAKDRSPEEVHTLRNLVLKKLIESRQAKEKKEADVIDEMMKRDDEGLNTLFGDQDE